MAGQIQLFRSVQEIYRKMGMYSRLSNGKWSFNWRSLFFLFWISVPGFGCLAFLVFKKASIFEYGLCFYAFVATILLSIFFLILRWQITNISKLFESFGKLIEEKNNKAAYHELNEKIERTSKLIHFALTRLTIAGVVIPFLLTTAVNYYIYDLGEESFHLPFPVMLPFDWKTPFVYLVALLLEATFAFCITYICVSLVCSLIGSAWLFIEFAKDITNEIPALNVDNAPIENHQRDKVVKAHLYKIIQLHSDVKQLIIDFTEIYKYIVTTGFGGILLLMTSSLLVLQTSIISGRSNHNSNRIEIITVLIETFWTFAITFVLCEFGQTVTDRFETIHDELCQCNWYSFSKETQKLYLTFITITQQPTNIQAYGNILCTRETSKKIINTAYSYFSTLRRICE